MAPPPGFSPSTDVFLRPQFSTHPSDVPILEKSLNTDCDFPRIQPARDTFPRTLSQNDTRPHANQKAVPTVPATGEKNKSE